MSDGQDRLHTVANLLGVDLPTVRAEVARARRAFPNKDDDSLVAIAVDALHRRKQQDLLDAARRSVGR